jgi:tetratricopeptide (TPR) repeat protein
MSRHAVVGCRGLALVFLWVACIATSQAEDKDDVLAGCKRAYQADQKSDWAAAALEYEGALQLAQHVFGADHEETAAIQNNLANDYFRLRQFAKAEAMYARALKTREAKLGAKHELVGETLHNLARLYQATQRNAKAEPLYRRYLAVAEAEHGKESTETAQALESLAIVNSEMGRNDRAEPLFKRCLNIREAKLGADDPAVARSLNNLANVYQETGRYAQAEPLFQRSLKIKEAKLGPDHLEVAQTLCNLANLYCLMEKYDQAAPLYQRSNKLLEDRLGADHPFLGRNLLNEANMYIAEGQYRDAVPLVERSLKSFDAKLPPGHSMIANCLDTLARLHSYLDEYNRSEPYYQRILKLREASLGPDHTKVAATLNSLAVVQQAMDQTDDAADTVDRARRIVRSHVARVLPVLNARGQLAFIDRADRSPLHTALTLGLAAGDRPALVERSAGWLINSKGVALESLAEHARLTCDARDPQLVAKIERLTALRTGLAKLAPLTPSPDEETVYQQGVPKIAGEEQKLAREVGLAAGRPALGSPWIEPAAVRGALPRDAVLIDIARFRPFDFHAKPGEDSWQPDRYAAWVIPAEKQGDVQVVDLGPAEPIDQAVERARQGIDRPAKSHKQPSAEQPADEKDLEQAALKPLRELAKLVLEPLLPALGDARELIVAPDSKLTGVPWAALPLADGKYAVERWQLRYVTSGRDLVLGDAEEFKRPTPPCVFADVGRDSQEAETNEEDVDDDDVDDGDAGDGDADDEQDDAVAAPEEQPEKPAAPVYPGQMMNFEGLDNMLGEASVKQVLAALAKESPVAHTGNKANEATFRELASPRVLAVSAGGMYLRLEGTAGYGGGPLTQAETEPHGDAPWSDDDRTLANPLSRTSISLAPSKRGREQTPGDGTTNGIEIAGCDLRGTELVVLGTCEPGLGTPRDDQFVTTVLGGAGPTSRLADAFEVSCDLRQAFQLAGARSVLSAQWQLPDADAAAILTDFFRNLAAGQSNAAALRAGQLARIAALRREHGAAHPFNWAALRITGN